MKKERVDIELMKKTGSRLREIRNSHNKSQEFVQEKTGLNVGRYERGEANISLTTISLFCKFYEISLEEFFKGFKI